MATLTTGQTLSDGDTVTSQTLHDMLENATIGSLNADDMAGGTHVLTIADTTPPDPNDGKFFWDSNFYLGQVFQVYAQPWNIWVTVGPDRLEIPFRNDSGGMLFRGALVSPSKSAASACLHSSNPSLSVIGFTQATAASGAYVPVAISGIGWVAYGSAVSSASNVPRSANRAEAFTAQGMPAGRVGMYGTGQNSVAGAGNVAKHYVYGMFLAADEDLGDAFEPNTYGYRALIWGPKLARYDPE